MLSRIEFDWILDKIIWIVHIIILISGYYFSAKPFYQIIFCKFISTKFSLANLTVWEGYCLGQMRRRDQE